jgi:hypothetical protein
MTALVWRSLGRVKVLAAALAAVLIGLQLSIIAAATSFAGSGNFGRLADVVPTFIMQVMGPALTSFRGMVLFAYIDPLIVMMIVQFAIYLASEPAGDVEDHLVDLVLARPLPRHWIISRSLVVMMLGTILVVGAMFTSTWLGLRWIAPRNVQWPEASTTLTLGAHVALIAWCFGSATLAASGWARRRGAVVVGIGVVAVAAYVVDFLETIWTPARALAQFSPFNYFPATGILAGTASETRSLGVLGATVMAFLAVAYWRYARRDL